MGAKLLDLKKVFLAKQKMLESARQVLKTEFVGIDKVIDEVIDNVSSWYMLSEIQEKPVVINLWGLTGVGKTSLITRLAELINFKDRFFRFDLGKKEGRFSFRDSLEDLCENNDRSPIIIALDEFQHSRTIVGPFREEVRKDENRMIWELIDSGKVQYIDWKRGLWSFEDYIDKLKHILKAGVVVEKGVVVVGKGLYRKEMKEPVNKGKDMFFVSEVHYEDIISFAGEQLNLYLDRDVRKILLELSGDDTIFFLKRVLKIGKQPAEKNFSKSLIFVLGNLDEAYTMNNNLSADMDADEFYKLSLKITVPKIKMALLQRFRSEQIARLGNLHIIYPALSSKAYLKIIKNELKKYAINLYSLTGLNFEFDESIVDIIYKEGVYPTQGVRPIFTSIQQVLKSKLNLFLSEILIKNIKPNRLQFSMANKKLACSYFEENSLIHSKQTEVITTLEDMRKSRKDDMQAISAVHESGHAILSAILLKTIPEVIYSVTSDSDNRGFVYSKFAWNYISRRELIPRVALMLGGYVAEEMVFGKEYLTAGASSDIEMATEFLSQMFKKSGMGNLPIAYGLTNVDPINTYHNIEPIENEVKQALGKAMELAQITLGEERKLLYKMSDYLSDNRRMNKNEIEKLITKHISKNVKFITNGELLYYRNQLKKLVLSDEIEPLAQETSVMSLNRDNE